MLTLSVLNFQDTNQVMVQNVLSILFLYLIDSIIQSHNIIYPVLVCVSSVCCQRLLIISISIVIRSLQKWIPRVSFQQKLCSIANNNDFAAEVH